MVWRRSLNWLGDRQMLKGWRIVAVVLLVACAAGLWIWRSYGYPTDCEVCKYAAGAAYNVGVVVLQILDDHSELVTAVATIAIAAFTYTLYVTTRLQLKHNRLVERAYVKVSPTPPGVSFGPAPGQISISLEIRNHNSTPASVTDVLVTADILPNGQALPEIPPYRRSHAGDTTAFLVSNDYFFFNALMYLDAANVNAARQGLRQLLIFGYVDYIDRFDQRHRGGFARRYHHSAQPGQTNLVFVQQPGYDYDIDW